MLAVLGARHELEVSGNVIMRKLYACPSGVARQTEGFWGISDPALPDGGAVDINDGL